MNTLILYISNLFILYLSVYMWNGYIALTNDNE